jgi:ADP-ribose pyrophosphatase
MSMERPVVPHEVRKIFEGRVFTVTVESITLPRGERLDAEIVRHPGSVVLVPVTDDGKVVLVRQYRHAVGRTVWELPAGSLKAGEDPDAAARRECQEEIGLIPDRLVKVSRLYPTPGYCDEAMNFYVASELRPPQVGDPDARPDEDEDLEARAFSVDEIRRMLAAEDIVDLKTVAGLALLQER